MSTYPQPEPVAEGVSFAVPVAKILPFLALFVRLAIGVGLLNLGLAAIMSSAPGSFGGPFGGPAGVTPAWGAPASSNPFAGLEPLLAALPYLASAIGVGLVLGIFTTVCALLACGLVLILPVLATLHLLVMGGLAFAPAFFGEIGIVSIVVSILTSPALVILALLSPPSINRYSIDSLIFARARTPLAPPPAEPPPAPDPDAPLAPDPLAGWRGPEPS